MADYANDELSDSTASAPAEVDAEGYSPVLYFYDRGPFSPPGNQMIRMCLICDQTPERGHAPDCTWKPEVQR